MMNKKHRAFLTMLICTLTLMYAPYPAYASETVSENASENESFFTETTEVSVTSATDSESIKICIDSFEVEDGQLKIYVNQNQGEGFQVTPDNVDAKLGLNELVTSDIRSFGDTDEPVSYMCVVDVSGSMSQSRIDEAKEIIKGLAAVKGTEDQIAICAMGNELISSGYMTDPVEIGSAADILTITHEDTNLYYAIVEEINRLKTSDMANFKGKKCLIIFSDGADDQATGITREEAEKAVTDSHIPVFTVGLLKNAISDNDKEMAKILGSFARLSVGGLHFVPALGDGSDDTIAQDIVKRINSSFVMYEELENVNVSGQQVALKVSVSGLNGQTATDTLNLLESDVKMIQEEIEKLVPQTITITINGTIVWDDEDDKDKIRPENIEIRLLADGIPESEEFTVVDAGSDFSFADRPEKNEEGAEITYSVEVNQIEGYETTVDETGNYMFTITNHHEARLIFGLPPAYFYAILALIIILIIALVLLIIFGYKKRSEDESDDEYDEESSEDSYEDDLNPTLPGEAMPEKDTYNGSVTMPVGNTFGGLPTMPLTSPVAHSDVHAILVRLGKGEEKSYKVNLGATPVTVGRSAANAKLAFSDDTALSSIHCSLIAEKKRVYIKDENSTNGTFVNGVPISGKFELNQDDVILIGSYEYRISWK